MSNKIHAILLNEQHTQLCKSTAFWWYHHTHTYTTHTHTLSTCTSTITYSTKQHTLAMSCTHVYAVHHIAFGRLVNTIKIVRWCCFACAHIHPPSSMPNGIRVYSTGALLLGAPCHCFGSPASLRVRSAHCCWSVERAPLEDSVDRTNSLFHFSSVRNIVKKTPHRYFCRCWF